ncbi:MAG: helix-turn-helix transcriptional regulator [Hyphomonadaceae bacterium]
MHRYEEQLYWPRLIKALRAREGLTQSVLAERLGVNQTAVSRWERGRDVPGLGHRRRLRTLFRQGSGGRQDRAVRLRVVNAWRPSTLMARGAVFLEINEAGASQAGVRRDLLQGHSIYGFFGAHTDEVTYRWERAGIFDGEIALSMSVNRLEGEAGCVHIRTLDTPYFSSDGEVWCLTDISLIDEASYDLLRAEWGGDTLNIPFAG